VQDKAHQNLTFLKRLEEFKLRYGLTWGEVAKSLGLSRTMLFYLNSGKHNVTAKVNYALDQAEKALEGTEDAGTKKVIPTAKPDRRLQAREEKELQLWMESIVARLETLPAAARKAFLLKLKKRFKA
jgi:transcriptional regulator with XRE-family HTH domain